MNDKSLLKKTHAPLGASTQKKAVNLELPRRYSARAVLGCASLCTMFWLSSAYAIKLGELQVQSRAGEPLRAVVEIIEGFPGEAEGAAELSIASSAEYKAAGLRFSPVLGSVRFEAFRLKDNRLFLRLSSAMPVEDTQFDVFLRGRWALQNLSRQYKLRLAEPDKKIENKSEASNGIAGAVSPPPILPAVAAVSAPHSSTNNPVAAASGTPATTTAPATAQGSVLHGTNNGMVQSESPGQNSPAAGAAAPPVQSPQTPATPTMVAAQNSASAKSQPSNSASLDKLPNALKNNVADQDSGKATALPGDATALKGLSAEALELLQRARSPQARLRAESAAEKPPASLPSPLAGAQTQAAQNQTDLLAENTTTAKSRAASGKAKKLTTTTKLQVQKGDTLLKIAAKTRTRAVTLEQVGLAIYQQNPEAFIQGNPNLLKPHVTLQLPTAEQMAAVSQQEAVAVLRSRNFDAYRQSLARKTQDLQDSERKASGGKIRMNTEALAQAKQPDTLTLSTPGKVAASEQALVDQGNKKELQQRLQESQQNQKELTAVQGTAQVVSAMAIANSLGEVAAPGSENLPGSPAEPAELMQDLNPASDLGVALEGKYMEQEAQAPAEPSFWDNWKFHIISLGLAVILLLLLQYMRKSRGLEMSDQRLMDSGSPSLTDPEPEGQAQAVAATLTDQAADAELAETIAPKSKRPTWWRRHKDRELGAAQAIDGAMELAPALAVEKLSAKGWMTRMKPKNA